MTDIIDLAPESDDFREALLRGLSRDQKSVPCKFLYDERGSRLFERICELDEYYPTRTELGIMREHAGEMADRIGPRALIVELGAGSGKKTHLLLEALEDPAAYLPIEISEAALRHCADTIGEAFPDLEIHPICADYTEPLDVPALADSDERTVAYFPGSTIGNFEPGDAAGFLSRIADLCGRGGGMLMGVDLYKSPEIIEPAYNDSEGVTAAFSNNLLRRANREAGADFDLEQFEHRAVFDEEKGRIEISQVSQIPQTVRVGDATFDFEEGEGIAIEYSYKFTPDRFRRLAETAGFRAEEMWTDEDELFSVWCLTVDE